MPSERGAATPGPWKVLQDNCGGGCNISIDGPKGPIIIARAMAVRSALALCGRAAIEEGEAQANARLIAAAPDLVAALKALVGLWDGVGDADTPCRDPDVVRRARAALAAAQVPPR